MFVGARNKNLFYSGTWSLVANFKNEEPNTFGTRLKAYMRENSLKKETKA